MITGFLSLEMEGPKHPSGSEHGGAGFKSKQGDDGRHILFKRLRPSHCQVHTPKPNPPQMPPRAELLVLPT